MSKILELRKLSNKLKLKGSGASYKQKPVFEGNRSQIFETNSSFHVKQSLRKNSVSIFQEIFSSTDKIFISGGGLSTRQ